MKLNTDKNLLEFYIKKYQLNKYFSNSKIFDFTILEYEPNEYICTYGSTLKYLYFFLEGKAKTYTTLSNGKSLLHCFCTPISILGEIELVTNIPTCTNVMALTNVVCIGIPLITQHELLLNDITFMKFISCELAKKLNRFSNNSSNNLLNPVEKRLASYIISTESNNIFSSNLTEVAELLGTSYRQLLRVLNKLCSSELLYKKNNIYIIKDKNKLLELGEDIYMNINTSIK